MQKVGSKKLSVLRQMFGARKERAIKYSTKEHKYRKGAEVLPGNLHTGIDWIEIKNQKVSTVRSKGTKTRRSGRLHNGSRKHHARLKFKERVADIKRTQADMLKRQRVSAA